MELTQEDTTRKDTRQVLHAMLDQLINNIGKSINKHNTAIFCGAGISYNSGLPLASDLVKKILEVIDIKEKDASIILNSNIPFEFFIETIRNEVSVDEILEIFSKGEPNTNHELIAELANAGFIKTVLTTNFDLLIEKALSSKGLQKGTHFEVFSTEKEFGKINWNDNKIKIIKLHGCISNKSEMAITLNAVASKTVCVNKNNIIKNFFSHDVNPNVIIIGYSCSDLFDISPQIELINEKGSEVFFIQHVNNSSDCRIEDITIKNYKNPFKSFTGKRISIDADYFIKRIWEVFVTKQYQLKYSSISWIENVNNWLSQAVETNSIGVKHHLPARLYYNIGEYEYSVKHYEHGISIAQNERNQITFYSELGNLGMALNALGRYKEAKRCLEESVKACHDIGNMQGEIAQMQSLGNIYRNLGDFDSALKVYTKAVSLAEKEDLDGLCTSLGNLASIFTQTEQPDEAIKCLEKGLKIAQHIGNKQSEGSMLCSIGIAYSQKGNSTKAAQYIQDSINTTRLIGDKQGECMALLNLSNVNLQNKNFDKCLANATSSLQIAKAISIRQSEAGAYYNIGSSYFFKGDAKSAITNLKNAIEIYSEIYGNEHRHTKAAIKGLIHAENFPELNKMTKTNLI